MSDAATPAKTPEKPKAPEAKVTVAAKAEDKPERFIPAAESNFTASGADFIEPTVQYAPEAGTPFEHVLRPEYWANLRTLRPGAHIWVKPKDDAWWAELFVVQVGQGYATVKVFRHFDNLKAEVPASKSADGYEIEWVSTHVKHRVVRTKDRQVLKEGLATREDAEAWLRDHRRVMQAA